MGGRPRTPSLPDVLAAGAGRGSVRPGPLAFAPTRVWLPPPPRGRQPSPPPRVLLPLFPRLEYAALCPSFVCSSPHSVSCPLPRLLLHPPPPLLAAAFRRELFPPALFHCQPQDSFIGPPCLFFAHHPPHLLHLGSPIRFPAFFYFLFFQIKGVIITVVT